METDVSLGYGFIFSTEAPLDVLETAAVYTAAQEIPSIHENLGRHFSEEDGEVSINYPFDMLGNLITEHPAYENLLTYNSAGDLSGFDDYRVIMIIAKETEQRVETAGAINPLVQPSAESIIALEEFKQRFFTDSNEVSEISWVMGSSAD